MLDKSNHIPLYIQIRDEIMKKIKQGCYKIDSKIPTEKDLMLQYNVGRATVREAISQLVNEGYLYKKQGIGTFVARNKVSSGFEPLISLTYSLKAKGFFEKNLLMEKNLITPDKKLLHKLKWKNAAPCFYIRRIRYVDNNPIALETSYFHKSFEEQSASFDLTGSIAKIIIQDLKKDITKIEQTIISRAASISERAELNLKENELVLDMERWVYVDGIKECFFYINFVAPWNIYSFSLASM